MASLSRCSATYKAVWDRAARLLYTSFLLLARRKWVLMGVGLRVWGLFQSGAVVGVALQQRFLFSATVVFGQGAVLWGNASFLPGGAGGRDKSLGMGFSPKQERSLYMAVQNGCTFADGALLAGKGARVSAWSNGSLIKQPLSLGGEVKLSVKWQIKKKALWHEFPSAFCHDSGLVNGKQVPWDD